MQYNKNIQISKICIINWLHTINNTSYIKQSIFNKYINELFPENNSENILKFTPISYDYKIIKIYTQFIREYFRTYHIKGEKDKGCSAICYSRGIEICNRKTENMKTKYCEEHNNMYRKLKILAKELKHYSDKNLNINMIQRPFSLLNSIIYIILREIIYIFPEEKRIVIKFLNNPFDPKFSQIIKNILYQLISKGANNNYIIEIFEQLNIQKSKTKILLLAKVMADLNIRCLEKSLCYPLNSDIGHNKIIENIKVFAEQLAEDMNFSLLVLQKIELIWWIKTIIELDNCVDNNIEVIKFINCLQTFSPLDKYYGNTIFTLYDQVNLFSINNN